MSKAILEFDLENPDDKCDFNIATNAKNYLFALREIDNMIRNKIKYCELNAEAEEELINLRLKLFAMLDDMQISLED